VGADPGAFAVFYASFLQHPLLLWLAAALGTAAALARTGLQPALRRYCLLLGGLSLLDAWWTSHHVLGFGPLQGWAASAVPLFFVLAGDFRFLLLAVAGTPNGGLAVDRSKLWLAAWLMLIVPLGSQLVTSLLPAALNKPRVLYLIYELAFFALTLCLLRWLPNLRANPWLRRVSRFVLLYYGLWATADTILLATGADLGFLLRVVPNVLYYGGLIAAMAWFAPIDQRS